ncbi:MAG: hypothetical protein NTW67_04485 [Candidatus Woesearchaeota archaeon]|nr:hypothetical protein [Candidatus Woesearchaeota archaeon]
MENEICPTIVKLLDEQYVVYLKEVPSRVLAGGKAQSTCVRAFVRKLYPPALE